MRRTRHDRNATLAGRLVRDVANASPYAPGRYSCPADFGRSVTLYFSCAHRSEAETVHLTLTGCAAIRTSTRTIGLQVGNVVADLAAITPPDLTVR